METPDNLYRSRIDNLLRRGQPGLAEKGFVVARRVFGPHDIEVALTEYRKFCSGAYRSTAYGIFRDERDFPRVINRADNVSDVLFDLARSKKLTNLAESIVGGAVVPLHVEYFSKPPLSSAISPPHQDQKSYQEHFADELAIGIWIALTDVDSHSGSLEFCVPPSTELLPHSLSKVVDFDFEVTDNPVGRFVPVELKSGDAVIHHAFVVHRSTPNGVNRPRVAIAFNYRTSEYRDITRAAGDK
jgi:ectoine hydroxylase-related dioxygenase (phytanoyl-CoA dioxygenase family)